MRDIILNDILIPSLQRLYKEDYNNILFRVSERNICARLAYHLEVRMRRYDTRNHESRFAEYYADVEYDKMNDGNLKYYENTQHGPKRMISDLLIHSRGIPRNYLAVEMKRKESYNKRREDRERLKSMVSPKPEDSNLQCVYETMVGTFIIYSPNDVKIEIYENVNGVGEKTDELLFDYVSNRAEPLALR